MEMKKRNKRSGEKERPAFLYTVRNVQSNRNFMTWQYVVQHIVQ